MNRTLTGAVQTGREWINYNDDDLVEAGLLSYCSPEDKALGHRSLVSGSNMQRLFVGAFTQVGDVIRDLTARLELTENKLHQLTA